MKSWPAEAKSRHKGATESTRVSLPAPKLGTERPQHLDFTPEVGDGQGQHSRKTALASYKRKRARRRGGDVARESQPGKPTLNVMQEPHDTKEPLSREYRERVLTIVKADREAGKARLREKEPVHKRLRLPTLEPMDYRGLGAAERMTYRQKAAKARKRLEKLGLEVPPELQKIKALRLSDSERRERYNQQKHAPRNQKKQRESQAEHCGDSSDPKGPNQTHDRQRERGERVRVGDPDTPQEARHGTRSQRLPSPEFQQSHLEPQRQGVIDRIFGRTLPSSNNAIGHTFGLSAEVHSNPPLPATIEHSLRPGIVSSQPGIPMEPAADRHNRIANANAGLPQQLNLLERHPTLPTLRQTSMLGSAYSNHQRPAMTLPALAHPFPVGFHSNQIAWPQRPVQIVSMRGIHPEHARLNAFGQALGQNNVDPQAAAEPMPADRQERARTKSRPKRGTLPDP